MSIFKCFMTTAASLCMLGIFMVLLPFALLWELGATKRNGLGLLLRCGCAPGGP